MSRRIDKVNVLLRQQISILISRDIKDPRVSGVITVTKVDVSTDLRNAKVYLSVMGDSVNQKEALDGIRSASSFLRRELRNKISLRYVPFLNFLLDDSFNSSLQMMDILDSIKTTTTDPHPPTLG